MVATRTVTTKRPFSPLLWLYLLPALLVVSIISFIVFQPITVLPRIALAPGFGLQNSSGELISNEDLRSGVTLYSFSAAQCAADCGQTQADIAAVQQSIATRLPANTTINLVTLALNEETPAQLANLGSASDNAPWQWLTGDAQRMRYIVGGGFNLYYEPQANGSVAFEPRYVLVDSLGMIRAYYFTAQPDTTILLRDINFLLEEATNSTGSKTLAYEAAHLFLCYPD